MYIKKKDREILNDIKQSEYLKDNWKTYKKSNYYVGNLEWEKVLDTTVHILKDIIGVLNAIV